MSNKLKCKLGFHNWHIIKSINRHSIEESVAEELDPCQKGECRPCVSYTGPRSDKTHKVCLDCEKRVNTIDGYREGYKQKMLRVRELGGQILPKKYKIPTPPPAPPKAIR